MTTEERIAQLEGILAQLAPLLDDIFNPNRYAEGRTVGFLVCAFDFGDTGVLTFVSNAERAGLVGTLKELIEKFDTVAHVVEPELTCNFRDAHDAATDTPTGKRCGAPATHVIEWDDGKRFSYACDDHLEIDDSATVKPTRVEKIA